MKKRTLAFATSFVLLVAFFFVDKESIPSNENQIVCIDDEPPSIRPISGNFSVVVGFGFRKKMYPVLSGSRKFHTGIDIKAPIGTPVVATSDGVIIKAENSRLYGNYILIRHDDEYETRYAHLSELKVKPGEKISKGSVIGLVGNTGLAIAPHLHYEVIKNGEKINPKDYYPIAQRI